MAHAMNAQGLLAGRRNTGVVRGLARRVDRVGELVVKKSQRAVRLLVSRTSDDAALVDAHTVAGCLFCQSRNETLNQVKIRTEHFFVRYDNFPATEGHVEIVPHRHVESFFDLTEAEFAELRIVLESTRKLLVKDVKVDGFNIGVNDGRAAGRTVDHLHIHLIPRRVGDVEDPRGGIRRGLPNGDPSEWMAGGFRYA